MEVQQSGHEAGPLSSCQAMCADSDWSNATPYAPTLISTLTGLVLWEQWHFSFQGTPSKLRFVESLFFSLFVAFVVVLASLGAH